MSSLKNESTNAVILSASGLAKTYGKGSTAVDVLKGLSSLNISLDAVTTELEVDGVKKFAQAWDDLLANVKAAQQG